MIQINKEYKVEEINKKNKKDLEIIGVYKIINKINNKMYIGSSNNIYKRWKEHINDLNKNKHHSIHLQRAWNKYGQENFSFIIIEIIKNEDFQFEKEQYWLDKYESYNREVGYNIYKFAIGGGYELTMEQRDKRRQISFKEHPNIINLYNKGYSTVEIAKKYKVRREYIWNILQENNVNTSDLRKITYKNKEYTITEFSNEFNIDRKLIVSRYILGYVNGEDFFKTTEELLIEKDFFTIVKINNKKYTFRELEKEFNIPYSTIRGRYYSGLKNEDLIKPILKVIPESEKENIIELLKKGNNLKDIGKIYSKSNATICRYLKKYNINFDKYFNYYKCEKIIKLRKENYTLEQIAESVDSNADSISLFLRGKKAWVQ